MLDDFAIDKVLVIAPLRVANTVWHNEAKEWDHLNHLTFSIITGSQKDRIFKLHEESSFYVINRENIKWLYEYYKTNKIKFPFNALIIDESSSFKSHSSQRFRALKQMLKFFNKTTILTGTPSPNGYHDLWSQIFILDQGERLGKNISMYRRSYFDQDYMGYNYEIKPGSDKKIQDKIKDIAMYVPTEGNVELPELVSQVVHQPLTLSLQKQYKEFRDEFVLDIDKSENSITAISAASLSNKLLQFSSGVVYDEEQNEHHFHDLKFDALDEIIEENPDENLLIAYNYKSELKRLKKKYPKARMLDSDPKTIEDWNNGKIKMLLAHPASAGHGLNLQKGGSIAIWFGFQWSLELYQQFNKRLHRSGQTKPVRLIHIAVGEIEYRLMKTLAKKDVTQKELLGGIG